MHKGKLVTTDNMNVLFLFLIMLHSSAHTCGDALPKVQLRLIKVYFSSLLDTGVLGHTQYSREPVSV